jgi:predicted MFS family arabinose efflux permease
VAVGGCDIAFGAASGAYVKSIVGRDDLLAANGRFESTTWSAIVVGPPLGAVAVAAFGPVVTVIADAASYLLSALAIRAIGGDEPTPDAKRPTGMKGSDLLAGWRHILNNPMLRPLFFNTIAVNGLIMATEPLLAVLLLDRLGFPPWQYGLAFAAPCLGGLIGSRLAGRVVARYGRHRVLRVAGVLRCCWLIGLALVRPGLPGLLIVMAVEFAVIVSMSLYNPVLAAYRLEQTPPGRVARTLSAWSIGSSAAIALCTALGGVLADATGPRTALVAAGLLILLTPLFRLPADAPDAPAPEPAAAAPEPAAAAPEPAAPATEPAAPGRRPVAR